MLKLTQLGNSAPAWADHGRMSSEIRSAFLR